jgi:hypothetical protein
MFESIVKQNKELAVTIESLAAKVNDGSDGKDGGGAKSKTYHPTPANKQLMDEINNMQLPTDIRKWRNAHVQAWLGFVLELPQYIDAFHKASVDGPVLLKNVQMDTLQNHLAISEELHCYKIVEGIDKLKQKQKKVQYTNSIL